MRALRPQYAYLFAHRQSNPVHPRIGIDRLSRFRTSIIHVFSEKVNCFSGFFLLRHHFLDGSAVFLSGQKAHNIFSMRKPRQKVDEKNQQKQKNDVYIRRFRPIAKPKENRLPNSEARNPDQRSHRSPFRSHDVKSDQPKRRKSDEKKPRILAAEIYPK